MRTPFALAAGATLVAAALALPATAAPAATVTTNGCVQSVPAPGSTTPQPICYSLFQPAGSDAKHPVPLVFHSHGWGGSRTKDASAFQGWLDAGFGVLSFDQRGFGESGGTAYIENPDYEGRDVEKLVSLVAGLDWVKQDGKGDPRIGAIGGSYGGGYQFVGAFRELMDTGEPVFDALAPEITWWDLKQSLAPSEVTRTEWVALLNAVGVQAEPTEIKEGVAIGAATGMWPKGQAPGVPDLDAFFAKNGPAWHVSQGRRLDIPVLFGQGETDNLFPLHQGLQNWAKALTADARERSIFVGYNGGHVLPGVVPPGYGTAGDPCSKQLAGGSFQTLAIRFMREKLKHERTGLTGYGAYHLATADGACATVSSVTPNTTYDVGTVATTQAAGQVAYKVADGPLRIAGTSYLDGVLTAAGVNNRAFYALAVGTSPADAQIVDSNVLPFNELLPVLGEKRTIELPSVAFDVPAGKSVYVVASGFSDMFAGMGSRTPGAVLIQDAKVRLPVVR
jgi:ABC-2 type transport system ATP-binding protein